MSEKILCLKQQTLSDIADSIRSQTGSVEPIPISDLDDAIENMAHQFNAQEDGLISGTITNYANETATKIRDYAFHKMSSLTSASFAAATSIGYSFDGCENIVVRNSKLISKDAFWNTKNVIVYDSVIVGEYLGWNSENVTFVNCKIESEQGLCYMKNIKMINCELVNTTLAFEYSTVDAEINNVVDSIKNPYGGTIKVKGVNELILEKEYICVDETKIIIGDGVDE